MNCRNTRGLWTCAWLVLASAGLLTAATLWQGRVVGQEGATKTPLDAAAISNAKSMSHAFRHAAGEVAPSVVKIRAHTKAHQISGASAEMENPFKGTPFERMFPNMPGSGQMPQRDGVGSGVIIDKSGLIVTNNHVVRGADEVTVVLADGTEYKATDIKTDAGTDLAVLRVSAGHDLPAAKLGDSEAMDIGDWVIAIGCPFQLDQTVTAGIISTKAREMADLNRSRLLQTDAAINPGNSGGPLVNLDGEVVGINEAIAGNSGGNEGIGFSIPSNTVKRIVPQLIANGHVSRAYIGVKLEPLSADLAEKLGVKVGEGVLVADVVADGPAAAGGVHEGDVVTSFGGTAVHNPREMREAVEPAPIGSQQTMQIVRDGKSMSLTVTTKALPERLSDVSSSDDAAPDNSESSSVKSDDLGLEVADMTADDAKAFKDADGVIIRNVTPESPAAKKGLQPGMLVRKVGRTPVKNVRQFEEAMKHESAKAGVLMQVHTHNGNLIVVLKKGG